MRILIRQHPATRIDDIVVNPTVLRVPNRPMRVLDFDVECRPMHWISNDFVSKEITAMAWAWCDDPERVTCYLLGETHPVVMLDRFVQAYDRADMVTGHFIRGFDLPLVNAAMSEYGLPPLKDKLSQDTKLDLMKRHGLSSSQENIGAMLDLQHPKVPMNQQRWREANRLTTAGLKVVKERVIGDVQQHIEMRRRLLALGYLSGPVVWRSGVHQEPVYTP